MDKKMWWDCDHEAKGLPGCPLCDKTLTEEVKVYLRQARVKILNQDCVKDNVQTFGDYFGLL